MRVVIGWIVVMGSVLAGCAHEAAPPMEPAAARPAPVIAERSPRLIEHTPISPEVVDPFAKEPAPSAAIPPLEELDDGKILKVAHTAHEAAITQARIAERRSRDQRVRELAGKIAKDNEAQDRRAEQVARVGKLDPSDSSISNALEADSKQSVDQLVEKSGRDFDRAFVDGELDRQRELLKLIDYELMPAASSPEVKALVRSLRPNVIRRFDELRGLQEKLGK